MRSHAIGALRLLGFTNIAEASHWPRDDFTRSPSSVSHNENNAISPGAIRPGQLSQSSAIAHDGGV
jgi:hypothetical protein